MIQPWRLVHEPPWIAAFRLPHPCGTGVRKTRPHASSSPTSDAPRAAVACTRWTEPLGSRALIYEQVIIQGQSSFAGNYKPARREQSATATVARSDGIGASTTDNAVCSVISRRPIVAQGLHTATYHDGHCHVLLFPLASSLCPRTCHHRLCQRPNPRARTARTLFSSRGALPTRRAASIPVNLPKGATWSDGGAPRKSREVVS